MVIYFNFLLFRAVYAEYHDIWQNLFHLWKLFKIAELFETIRQKGDLRLFDLLNKVRIPLLNETDEQLLKSRFVVSSDINYPSEALHIFAENKPAHSHNLDMITRNESTQHCIPAIDVINKALNRNQR